MIIYGFTTYYLHMFFNIIGIKYVITIYDIDKINITYK